METTVNIIDLLKQLAVAVPLILVATQTITAAIHGAFHIKNDNLNHAISWIVAVLGGIGFVAFNGLDFGLSTAWNYVMGGLAGLITGGAANGFYDWPLVKRIFDAITNIFGGKSYNTYLDRMYDEEKELKERIVKLENFIKSNVTYRSLPTNKRIKLEQQLESMRTYEHILAERISLEQKK